jgi:subtilisin family serine protease
MVAIRNCPIEDFKHHVSSKLTFILKPIMKISSFNRLMLTVFSAAALVFTSGCESPSAFQADEDLNAVQSSPFSNNGNALLDDKIPGQLIVTFKPSVANPELTARGLANANGGEVLYTYTTAIKGFTIRVPEQAAETVADALRRNPNVASVEQDGVVYAINTQSPATWGLDRIDQRTSSLDNSYTYNQDGTGVSVYVVDSGVLYGHVDFGGRAVFGYDAVGGLSDPGSDCNGHGTHVAGTVGGTTWGVAKNATLVSVRVLGCNGSGSWSGVLAGIDWITKNGKKPGVVNMSLGATGTNSTLETAVTNSINAGFTYAIAAGNSSADACNFTPARTPAAITVGSTTNTDARSSFSNYGTCVDIFAPGSSIKSTYHTSSTATSTLSGTSMASPHVAGVAALYLQQNPGASASNVRNALVSGATQGVVTNSLSANNHLLYSILSGSTPPPPPPPPPSTDPISLTATGSKVKGLWSASLKWTGATSTQVDVKRNGSKVATVSNTGSYTYNMSNKGSGSITLQVCEAGTTTCSNIVTVVY